MQPKPPGTVEQALQQGDARHAFLTPAERGGRWRELFGDAAPAVPHPYWLYSEAEQAPVLLGFPLRVSSTWEAFGRELTRLLEAEASYRRSLALHDEVIKAPLVEHRRLLVGRIAEILDNAYLHDYGQRLPEIFLLILTREISERLRAAVRTLATNTPELPPRTVDEIRYAIAQRLADVTHRARTHALDRLRNAEAVKPSTASRAFADLLRDDLLPFGEMRFGAELRELGSFIQGHLHLDAARFQGLFRSTTEQLRELRELDPNFDRVLASMDAEAPALPADRLLFSKAVIDLLEIWPHPRTPSLSPDMRRLLIDLACRCKRFEVISTLRDRIFPVSDRGFRTVTQVQGQVVQLSNSTRPFDFTSPGVLPSVVRRYGLLYDLVEFTQIIEELRRRGRGTEEQAMRQMVRFLGRVDEIRERHRLRFEKFLGDGAFYSARSARGIFLAGAELRLLYERMRKQGFPFERGLRLAMNVGTYHLLPMFSASGDRSHFEFFGHGLVELARLTTGKTTHEVEDITDFLIAAGYDLNRVLQFLEPVRHANRFTEFIKDRPYAAFIAENGELVNLGGVATESFLRDLESDWGEVHAMQAEHYGMRWLLIPTGPEGDEAPWVGLRALGTARLKGLEPTQLAEVMVIEHLLPGAFPLEKGTPLLQTIQRLSADALEATEPGAASVEVDPHLCVASVLEDEATRTWYIGTFEDEVEALASAFRVKLAPVGLKDGEPFESWLFQHRADLAKLYQGLRRQSPGATVPLEDLRRRDGYFTCLLATPHRSPR
ncbi:MAG TPA: hypothetical protein VMT45_01950 [Thermoanaerobaculaceae bacterium]|nr:hypothetical protein [Thermoanaerobaculaceae bacterium]